MSSAAPKPSERASALQRCAVALNKADRRSPHACITSQRAHCFCFADYASLARRLASSRALLAALKQRLVRKERLPLFDTQRWVRNFDRLLQMRWDVRAARSPSHHIAVSDPIR